MIFTESTIKISNNVSKMDSTIVLYRGDKNVEIRFTILQSPFKYSNTVATNVIESTNASYGQLVIKTPNDKPPIFSEVSATKEGTVLFTITKEMIDEIEELGVYTFQIRLMDENKQSRVTIPPVENGIEIKEPIAIEDDNTTNVVGLAKANYAVVTSSDVDTPTFDDNGKYNKTNWNDGDIITNASLNKIEDGIYTTNENIVIRPLPVHTIQETTAIVIKVVNIMDLIDGVTYSTHKDLNETRRQSYRVAYVCDDGSFKVICTLSLTNKIVHLVKVIHFAQNNYSVLSDNNTVYTVDYSKHSTNTDIQITKTLQNYLPINNTTEYTPTENYHPATKKYVDDNLTTIKEGITTSDAELIDARTDAEGVVHTNVGDALRATDKKINRIKEDIDYTVIENTSKISVALKEENTELLENKLYTTDGTIETSDRYSTLYYKLDKNAVSVDLRKIKIGVYGGAFVTKDKTWISSFETTGADIDTSVPKNAYYIGISVSNEWKYVHTLPITIRNNSVKFNNLNIDNIQIPASNPCNHWKGKKILWLGTSVSYGSNATTSYAVEACNILECNLLNTSMPGLAIHTQADGTKMTYGSTTLSKAEYKAQGVTIPDSPNTYIPGGDNYNDYYRTWENIFNDSTKDYDLYVFDVLPNNTEFKLDDWDAFNKDKWEYTDGSSFADHRTTFIGALLFLLDKLYEINPMARVVFVLGSEFQYWTKNTSFKPVAEQYRIGVIDIWSKVNLTPKSKLQILSKDGTDNHPSTYAHKLLGQILANELLLIR